MTGYPFTHLSHEKMGIGDKVGREIRPIRILERARLELAVTRKGNVDHVLPACIRQFRSQLHPVDHTDPVFAVEIPVGKLGNKRKHLIRKSTDVQNVATLLRLGMTVRLDVNTNELRIAVTRLEFVPL